MRVFLSFEAKMGYAFGVIALLIVAITDASAGATYLIALGVGTIGLPFVLNPDRARSWRGTHRPRGRR